MGSSPAPIYVEGLPESNCWGVGLPFGSGLPPEFITVHIQDVKKSANWQVGDGETVTGFFSVVQLVDGFHWQSISGSDVFIELTFESADTDLRVRNAAGSLVFVGNQVGACAIGFENQFAGSFENGSAQLFLPRP
jgi:hypothetical protein